MPRTFFYQPNLRIWNEQSLQHDEPLLLTNTPPPRDNGQECVYLSLVAGMSTSLGAPTSAWYAQKLSTEKNYANTDKVIDALLPGFFDLIAVISIPLAIAACKNSPPPGSSDDKPPRPAPVRAPETRREMLPADDWTAEILLIGAATAYAAWETVKFVGGMAAVLAFGN